METENQQEEHTAECHCHQNRDKNTEHLECIRRLLRCTLFTAIIYLIWQMFGVMFCTEYIGWRVFTGFMLIVWIIGIIWTALYDKKPVQ